MFRSILPAGALIASASLLLYPVVPFFSFLWPVVGGALATSFYRHRTGQLADWKRGFNLGAGAGTLAILLISLLALLSIQFGEGWARFIEGARDQFRTAAQSQPEVTSEVLAMLTSDRGIITIFLLSLLLFLLIFALLGGIGGAISASMATRREGD
jgi:hypothetical protein